MLSSELLSHSPAILLAAHIHGGRESASCAHTLSATSEGRGTHFRLRGRHPPSHLSFIPDMLIPAVVVGKRGEEIDWRSAWAGVRMPSSSARGPQSEKVWSESSCCCGGIWEKGSCLSDWCEGDCLSASAIYLLWHDGIKTGTWMHCIEKHGWFLAGNMFNSERKG